MSSGDDGGDAPEMGTIPESSPSDGALGSSDGEVDGATSSAVVDGTLGAGGAGDADPTEVPSEAEPPADAADDLGSGVPSGVGMTSPSERLSNSMDQTPDSSEGEQAPAADIAAEDDASSWRYQDGQLVRLPDEYEEPGPDATTPLSRASYGAWTRVGNGYISSNGSYIPGAVRRGVDVSEWDEQIDWAAAKADDVSFAIIRCGYAGSFGGFGEDDYWSRNVAECERLGISFGVYFYSRATTPEQAVKEAQYVLGLIKGHALSYPVYLDLEDNLIAGADLASVARAFCDTISAAGYQPGVYASLSWWNNQLDDPTFDAWPRWVAQYNSACHYAGDYGMWQCTSTGSVAGFHTGVDVNFIIDRNFVPGSGSATGDGWHERDGHRYFYENGRPLTGEWQIGDAWYYFDPSQGGAVYTGERWDGENWYYYDPDEGGVLVQDELVTLRGSYLAGGPKTVYYDELGRMVTGEREIDGSWYYFDPARGGAMATGVVRLTGSYLANGPKTVFYDNEGRMATGEQEVGGSWYYFDPARGGAMATGFVRLTGTYLAGGPKTVYYGSDGCMVNGEIQIGGSWYYFDPARGGAMAQGFVRLEGAYLANGPKTVYYDGGGRMVEGERQINGAWYYFGPGGAMASNQFVTLTGTYLANGPKTVYYDESGHMVFGNQVIDGRRYYFEPGSGALIAG